MKHSNISIFVPHTGCPHLCSFCNQRTISGVQHAPTGDEVRRICEKALKEVKACDIVNIKKILISKFGRKYFYSRRNGVTPIPPSEQEYIKKVFAEFGYQIAFDKIVKETLW